MPVPVHSPTEQLLDRSVCQAVHFRQIFAENVIVAPPFTTKWTALDNKMAFEAKQSAMVSTHSRANALCDL